MKIKHILLGALLFISMGMGTAQAASLPLQLDYTVTPTGNNRYRYDFTLTLTNADNSWSLGQDWGHIRFGNQRRPGTNTPLTSFRGHNSSLADTPFDRFLSPTQSEGPGVTRYGVRWRPTAVGESLSWSGTSTANLDQGDLLWGAYTRSNGAAAIQNAVAVRLNPIPEPGTFVLAGMGLVSLMGLRRREQRA